jgi:FlaA1/EpsC-like NDP-sugar epimerase
LVEELSTDAEHADKTKHPKVFIGRIRPHELALVNASITALLESAHAVDTERVRALLGDLVPEYRIARSARAPSPDTETRRTGPTAAVPN